MRNWVDTTNRKEFKKFALDHTIRETMAHFKISMQTYYKIAEEVKLTRKQMYRHRDGIMRSLNENPVNWYQCDFRRLVKLCKRHGL